MNDEQWLALEREFHRVRALPPQRRADEIERVAAGDAELGRELDSLLRTETGVGSILDQTALEWLAALQVARIPTLATYQPGDVVSHYEILAPVDQGGMGAVYKARDTRLGRIVALKFVSDPVLQDAGAMRNFVREARAASAISHPNICIVHDVDSSGEWPFIVTEFLEGESLRRRIDRGTLAVSELLPIALAVCDALAAAHAHGLVHLDIKPGNIFLTVAGVAKVLDFGAAAWLQEEATADPNSRSAPLYGTARYMAPERRQGINSGPGADIYALGVVMRDALGLDQQRAAIAAVDRGVRQVIERATEADPARRYQRIEEMAADLRALVKSRGHWRARASLALVVCATAVVASVAAYSVRRYAEHERARASPALVRPTAVAVMPFAATSVDSDALALAEGLTRELTDRLSAATTIPVLMPSAVFHAASGTADPEAVGRMLKASTLVLGSLRRVGDRISLDLRISDVASKATLWSRRFDRPIGSLAETTREAAGLIARQLDVESLRHAQADYSARSATDDPLAYQDYLRGQYFFHREDVASLRNAIKYYRMAVDHDPNYAAAYVGWAEALSFGAYTERLPAADSWSEAEGLLETALRLDPQSGLAHALRGSMLWLFRCQPERARQDFDQALALAPGDLTVLDYHSYYLLNQRQFDLALAEKRRVLHGNPVSVSTNAEYGLYLMVAGRYEEAELQLKSTLELDSRFVPAIMRLAETYQRAGRYEQAVAQYRRAVSIEPTPERWAALASAYALWHKRAEALGALARLDEASRTERVSPTLYAQVYTALGDAPNALKWLARATPEDQPWPGDPMFEPLHRYPAFKRIAIRVRDPGTCPQT